MGEFNYKYLLDIGEKNGVSMQKVEALYDRMPKYAKAIEERGLGFYKVISDEETVKSIEDFAVEVEGKYENIVILGIGGSALSATCLKQAFGHLYANEVTKQIRKGKPKLHVLDNIDPHFVGQLMDAIEIEKTLFIVISKSGKTPETMAQYFYFKEQCEINNLAIKDHFVFITRPDKGYLRATSKKEDIKTFDIPRSVGGRFSVFTPVGLLPAALIGIDIRKLLLGAKEIAEGFLSDAPAGNSPFTLACMQYLLYKKGKNIHVMMPYSQNLIGISDWYRQLMAESIGKKEDVGITPVKAIGATDQHSQCQLYNDGPNDKLFMFFRVEKFDNDLGFEHPNPEDELTGYLKDVTFNKLMHTEMDGTMKSLIENDRPVIQFWMEEINEQRVGWLLMLFMTSTAYLGEFFEIDAFDQPGVELSKKLTKEML